MNGSSLVLPLGVSRVFWAQECLAVACVTSRRLAVVGRVDVLMHACAARVGRDWLPKKLLCLEGESVILGGVVGGVVLAGSGWVKVEVVVMVVSGRAVETACVVDFQSHAT